MSNIISLDFGWFGLVRWLVFVVLGVKLIVTCRRQTTSLS